MNQKLIKALKKVHTIQKLGHSQPNVWIENNNENLFQSIEGREDAAKHFSRNEVEEMMTVLELETVFIIPDNGRD